MPKYAIKGKATATVRIIILNSIGAAQNIWNISIIFYPTINTCYLRLCPFIWFGKVAAFRAGIVIYMFHNILYYPLTLPLSSDILTIMDTNKIILVVRKIQYSHRDDYYIEKTANTLDEASKYLVALQSLNNDESTTYHLFNAYGIIDAEKNASELVEEKKEIRPLW